MRGEIEESSWVWGRNILDTLQPIGKQKGGPFDQTLLCRASATGVGETRQNQAESGRIRQNLAESGSIWQNVAESGRMWQNLAESGRMRQNFTPILSDEW